MLSVYSPMMFAPARGEPSQAAILPGEEVDTYDCIASTTGAPREVRAILQRTPDLPKWTTSCPSRITDSQGRPAFFSDRDGLARRAPGVGEGVRGGQYGKVIEYLVWSCRDQWLTSKVRRAKKFKKISSVYGPKSHVCGRDYSTHLQTKRELIQETRIPVSEFGYPPERDGTDNRPIVHFQSPPVALINPHLSL